MTIKSNGGVFGRNPTYNNTTVDGTLRVADKIVHIGDEDTNLRFPEVNTFSVETNGAERLRVTDAGRLGIGTTTPAGVLHTRSLDPFNLPLRIENTGGSTTFDVRVGSGGTLLQTNGNQFISMAPNAVQSTQFLTNGNVSLLTGNLIIGTSGKGIDFSATAGTGTSELFDDYEEGTVASPLRVGGTTITSGYALNITSYTKVGNMSLVNINFDYTSPAGTGPSGAVTLVLPFAPRNSVIIPTSVYMSVAIPSLGIAYVFIENNDGNAKLTQANVNSVYSLAQGERISVRASVTYQTD